MKKNLRLLFFVSVLPFYVFSQTTNYKLEKTTSFFPNDEILNKENIEWGYLTVPENWDSKAGKSIKIAVALIKSTAKNPSSLVYLEGGPGAGGIKGINRWINCPLRENNNIILIDTRGTGNSLPRLCPDLGKKFLEILSKNQSSSLDEEQKVIEAISCKQELLAKGIDITQYNSQSISKDLTALKKALGLEQWNVYGTYEAQVYANNYPQDIKSLILDSPISDISAYYNLNTVNYMTSLEKVFDACKNDPNCNKQFPNLEATYYQTIENLTKNPITVKIDKKIIPGGSFTYNAEDFKVSIHQALYKRGLIEVLPLLITEVNGGNKNTLSSLVNSFSGALGLDYGLYYCVSCNEVLPFNSLDEFDNKSLRYGELKGGLSFYRSDYKVCDKWNLGIQKNNIPVDLSTLHKSSIPTLIFSGAFDPITPATNGLTIANKLKNNFYVIAPISGHAPSLMIGMNITNNFISDPSQKPDFKKILSNKEVSFVTNIKMNAGVAKFAGSLNEFNLLFFAPLFIAILVVFISLFNFIYTLIKNKKDNIQNKFFQILIVITSLLGLFAIVGLVFAVNSTVEDNFYILAFGLATKFNYLFIIQWVFLVFILILIAYFLLKFKYIMNASIVSTILFSLVLIGVYFQYWGFLF